jgi:hypothetical protein
VPNGSVSATARTPPLPHRRSPRIAPSPVRSRSDIVASIANTQPSQPLGQAAWSRALEHVARQASGPALDPTLSVSVHFHPDRPVGEVLLLRHLGRDRVYRSQFETGTSNGGLTAHPGGDRWRWEQRMFGGAYDHTAADQRPKYGSLNYRRRPAGGSVRFGSSHLRLAGPVLSRTTFCYPDSSTGPAAFATAAHMSLIELAQADDLDELDDHIEAHVHGPLSLDHDVAALVLDPAYRGTEVEAAAADLPFPYEWHPGFRLSLDELRRRSAYRGPNVVRAGVEIAENGWLDARIIGDAARQGRHPAQTLKQVWHCTARYGQAADR